jgi:hypothetical protein
MSPPRPSQGQLTQAWTRPEAQGGTDPPTTVAGPNDSGETPAQPAASAGGAAGGLSRALRGALQRRSP